MAEQALIYARAISLEDLELLHDIDQAHALKYNSEPQATRAALSFYQRSGHSFVALQGGEFKGFVLAQAVWSGTRPTVSINYIAVKDDDSKSYEALIEAVLKSSYDAAVYDLLAQIPSDDTVAVAALNTKSFSEKPLKVFSRVLGSRASH